MVIHLTGYATVYGFIATEPELQLVYDYLLKSFDGKPVPELPQAWIDKWGYY
ncbi:MAG: hypothetical protein ABIG98_02435 [Chloroflexota bacterium]